MPVRARAYLELTRVSNLPTVVTNALAGVGAASLGGATLRPWPIVAAPLGAACLYLAGMALNDLADRRHDAVDRPQRPIPSGRISPRAALGMVIGGFVAGLAVLATTGLAALAWGGALVIAIVAYDLLHKRFAGAAIIMGLCRALVYPLSIAAVTARFIPTGAELVWGAWLAGVMWAYIVAVTVVAQAEARPLATAGLGWRRWVAVCIPVFVVAASTVASRTARHAELAGVMHLWGLWLPALVLVAYWMVRAILAVFARPPRVQQAVMIWLASICLVDMLFLAVMARAILAVVALGLFGITLIAHRRIIGT